MLGAKSKIKLTLCMLLVLLLGAFLTQRENELRIAVQGRDIQASTVDIDIAGTLEGETAFSAVRAYLQDSAGDRVRISSFEVRSPGALLAGHGSRTFPFLGWDLFGASLSARGNGYRATFGDWILDRFYTDAVVLFEGKLPEAFEIKMRISGRGNAVLALQSQGSELRFHVRDGFIDNDYSLCRGGSCIAAGETKESPLRNVLRILNLLFEIAAVGSLAYLVLLLCALAPFESAPRGSLERLCAHWWSLVVVAGVAAGHVTLVLWFQSDVLGSTPHIPDSAVYVRQAIMIASGLFTGQLPDGWPPQAFVPNGAVVDEQGRYFFHYNRFWPALLSLGAFFGRPELVNPVLSSLSLVLVAAVGARLFGRGAALCSAVMYAVSPIVIMNASDFMTHMAVQTFLLLGVWVALCACEARDERKKALQMLAVGLLWGVAFSVRQYTTMLVVAPLAYLISTQGLLWRSYIWAILGFLPAIVLLLLDNYSITGSLFIGPYQRYHNLSISLEHITYGANWTDSTLGFLAPALMAEPLGKIILALVPLALILRPSRPACALAAVLPSLVIGHLFFNNHGIHGYGPRMLYEALFALFLLAGLSVSEIISRGPLLLKCAIVLLIAVAGWRHAALMRTELPSYKNYNAIDSSVYRSIEMAGVEDSIFVFEDADWQGIDQAARLFDPRFQRALFLKGGLGPQQLSIIQHFPERKVYRVYGSHLRRIR